MVLGCDTKKDRGKDSVNLINYVFNNFQKVNIKNIIKDEFDKWYEKHLRDFHIDKASSSNVELYLNESQILNDEILVKKDMENKITTNISYNSTFAAPLIENTEIGVLDVFIDNEKAFSVQILNKNTIQKKTIKDYLTAFLENYVLYFEN